MLAAGKLFGSALLGLGHRTNAVGARNLRPVHHPWKLFNLKESRFVGQLVKSHEHFKDGDNAADDRPYPDESPYLTLGLEEALIGFITGKKKVTDLAHSVWKCQVRKGDTVIDATCGNGHDTVALLKLVADESGEGCVYGFDIQESALESTSYTLNTSASDPEQKMAKLFHICHSKMEEIVPKGSAVRLVSFNLGYLPGGDKTIITMPGTTKLALEAASRILSSQGLISLVAYVGHVGGREELAIVESFGSKLPAETWASCRLETFNRPNAPILFLFYKRVEYTQDHQNFRVPQSLNKN